MRRRDFLSGLGFGLLRPSARGSTVGTIADRVRARAGRAGRARANGLGSVVASAADSNA
jgi:hypothetical protein